MKTAETDAGKVIAADISAPREAICPYCRSEVTLRRRRLMDGSVSYFWRHRENLKLHCIGRSAGSWK